MKRRITSALAGAGVVLAAALTGCSTAGSAEAGELEVLKLGVPPGEADPEFLEQMQPIADEIAEVTGKEVEVTKTSDYLAIVEAMRSGLIDLALFSPTPTVLAQDVANATPLIAALGAPYTSEIVCSPDAGVEQLTDVQDKQFAFVDPGSTSGNYVPRFHMKNNGVDIDNLDETFAGGHDSALLAVKQGSVDCAAAASSIIDSMIEEDVISEADIDRVSISDPIPISMTLIAREGLPEDITTSIADTLVETQNPAVLEVTGATELVHAEDADWSLFEGIVEDLGVGLDDAE
jgi:phosphonate transport system substrate-binding protein